MEPNHADKRRPLFDRFFDYLYRRKPSDRLLLVLVALVFVGASFYTAKLYNDSTKTTVATAGGTFIEGVVGTPRFANPVLAITRADQDVTALVYAGLMRLTPKGELVPDLAESVTISDDGLVYNIILKENIFFHDETPVQSDDVAYTIALIQDPLIKSPLRGNWNDVVVEVISEREFNLVLREAYTPFIENLTVGIMPKHIWQDLTAEQIPFSQNNTEPIGAGPYRLDDVDYNRSGLIEAYTLKSFPDSSLNPNISTLILRFYQNEETLETAFAEGDVSATAGLSVSRLNTVDTNDYTIVETPLPRLFSVFLNQNKSTVLREQAVREALSVAIDREAMVEEVLAGHGVPSTSAIPAGFLAVESSSSSPTTTATTTSDLEYAKSLLIEAGWVQQDDRSWVKEIDDSEITLAVAITTANSELFERTAEHIRERWEALGVRVSIALFEQSDLVQVIIRPRDYEALLFGTDIGRQLDLYPFWHSSQKDDPGLNIASYTNITTDEYLETARSSQDESERTKALLDFAAEVQEETPAIFLYSPAFTYVVQSDVGVSGMDKLVKPHERFSNIHTWFMSEHNVWPFFQN